MVLRSGHCCFKENQQKMLARGRKSSGYISTSSLTVRGNNNLKVARSYRTRGQSSVQLSPGKNCQEYHKCPDTGDF